MLGVVVVSQSGYRTLKLRNPKHGKAGRLCVFAEDGDKAALSSGAQQRGRAAQIQSSQPPARRARPSLHPPHVRLLPNDTATPSSSSSPPGVGPPGTPLSEQGEARAAAPQLDENAPAGQNRAGVLSKSNVAIDVAEEAIAAEDAVSVTSSASACSVATAIESSASQGLGAVPKRTPLSQLSATPRSSRMTSVLPPRDAHRGSLRSTPSAMKPPSGSSPGPGRGVSFSPSTVGIKSRRIPSRTTTSRVSAPPRLPLGPASMDLTRFTTSAHGHPETGGALSRVIMVRKTEQRVYTSHQGSQVPKVETLTKETVETFRGNRTQRKVTTCQKRDGASCSDLAELRSAMSSGSATPLTTGSFVSGASSADPGRRSPSSSPDSNRPASRVSTSTATSSSTRLCKSKSRSLSDGESCFGEDFAQDCLRAHNEYRAKHGVVPLKLSKKLCRYSEEWAKQLAQRGVMEHRKDSDYGENIFCSWSSVPGHSVAGDEPVHHWYDEIKDHKFGREPTTLKSGHFTQVVWKDSRELGVAIARSKSGQVFVVANYSPPGNFVGCFAENVPPVGGFPQPPGTTLSPVREGRAEGQGEGEEDLAQEGLRVHNEYRRLHGCPALRLNPQLCEYARDWARTLAREDRFAHRPDGRYGENIFCAWSPDGGTKVGAKEACDTWYKEIKDHPFGQEPRLLKSGHFSQMVWKNSRELGMGLARSKNGRILIVANYQPRGNYIGQFTENVPKPLSGPNSAS